MQNVTRSIKRDAVRFVGQAASFVRTEEVGLRYRNDAASLHLGGFKRGVVQAFAWFGVFVPLLRGHILYAHLRRSDGRTKRPESR